MKQWEAAFKGLIEKAAMRRASERSNSRLIHFSPPSGYPSSRPRNGTHDRGHSTHSAHVSSHPHPYPNNGHRPYRQSSPYVDPDDDFDDYSAASSVSPTSDCTTGASIDGRRGSSSSLDTIGPPIKDENLQHSSYRRPTLRRTDRIRSALSLLGDDSPIGGSSSNLDTIRPLINHENRQLLPYASSTDLQSNGSLYNASFMTSPSHDSSRFSSSLDTIRPLINRENRQLLPYASSTDLQSNGSLHNASFITSPSYVSSRF